MRVSHSPGTVDGNDGARSPDRLRHFGQGLQQLGVGSGGIGEDDQDAGPRFQDFLEFFDIGNIFDCSLLSSLLGWRDQGQPRNKDLHKDKSARLRASVR